MKTFALGLVVLLAAHVSAAEPASIYTPSERFAAAIRGQDPPPTYDEDPNAATQPAMPAYVEPAPAPMQAPIYGNPYQSPGYDPFMGQQGMAPYSGVPGGPIYGANGPQPYKLGWTGRYNFGYLPSESTDAGFGDIGIFEFDADWRNSVPGANGWIYSFSQEYGLRMFDGPTAPPAFAGFGFPNDVHHIGWDFEMATSGDQPWSYQLAFNPSINTDFEHSPTSRAWNLDARAIAFYRVAPQFMWAIGVGFWDRVHNYIIPYAGFVYTPDPRWELRLMSPQSRLSYFMGNYWGYATWIYAQAEYHVESYEMEFEPIGRADQMEIRDYRAVIGIRGDRGWYAKFFEAGWVFNREIDFLRGGPDLDVDSGFIARAGLRF